MSLHTNLNSTKSPIQSLHASPLRSKTPLSITKANCKKEIRSPKSVSSYLKELNNQCNPNNSNHEETKSTQKARKTIGKSSVPEVVSDINAADEYTDPTSLGSILNALKSSSKGLLPYPEPIHSLDKAEEVCDFKFIGGLSHLSFSHGNSFRSKSCDEDENEEEDIFANIHKEKTSTSFNRSHRSDAEDSADSSSSDDDLVSLSQFNHMAIVFEKINLEQERTLESQINCIQKRDEYLQKLLKIRESAAESLRQSRLMEKQVQMHEAERLEQQKKAIEAEAEAVQKQYLLDVQQKRAEIQKEIELANIEAAEKEAHLKSLIKSLEEPFTILKGKLIEGQADAAHFPKDSEVSKILFEELPTILVSTGKLIEQLNSSSSSGAEIQSKLIAITDAIKIVEDIQRLIKDSKQQQQNQHTNETQLQPQQEANDVSHTQQGSLAKSDLSNLGGKAEQIDIEPLNQIQDSSSPQVIEKNVFQGSQKYYSYLKMKFNQTCEEANEVKENIQLRPLLARAAGIINQLNNDRNDSSNRGKLQQIFNLISGRSCSFGNETISTQNNPSAQAFVKEQLASKIITLSHDKQVSSMAIYASLIVRLWQLYPDVGELIIFKLYETCPFLVPLTIKREASQSEEEFYRSLGFRHKDGGTREAIDKYLTRMGSAAQLYGRIVAMDIEKHPHGIEHGWIWLAKILTVPPYPNVTAALLYGFLSVAGSALLQRYGRQFRKMLQFLCVSYLPLIENETLEGGHSDVVGMKQLLLNYQNTGRFSQPDEGYKLLL